MPAAVLVLWSLVMLVWLGVARFAAFPKLGIDLSKAAPGGRGTDLDPALGRAAWPSHNYQHLMEQPTLFYATVAILALTGASGGTNTGLAWAYVGLRIVHSVWQATVNRIPVRFGLFLVSSLCLIGLAVNALRAAL